MISPLHPSSIRPLTRHFRTAAFTLIELLAVICVIALLTGLLIGVASYSQRKAGVSATRTELYAIAAALEMYKSDYGNYPLSKLERYSQDYSCEKSNSWILFRALIAGPKRYLKLDSKLLLTDTTHFPSTEKYIADSFGIPLNYYRTQPPIIDLSFTNSLCAPVYSTYYGVQYPTNFIARGGQINTLNFDLFSYGPDRQTYLPNLPSGGNTATNGIIFNDPNTKTDDIWYR